MSNRIDLIHVTIPMTEPFRISSGKVSHKDSIIIRIQKDGIEAFGEASPMAGGFYSQETPESTFDFLKKYAIPKLIQKRHFRPQFVTQCLMEDQREMFAWAGLEGALWDLRSAEEDVPFPDAIGIEPRLVESGLAVGIYPTLELLLQACEKYMRDGYKRLKIKIQPGWDLEPLHAIREAFGQIPLMVDANAAYGEEHFPIFDEMDKFDLLMIEQPLSAYDLNAHNRLQVRLNTPICLDESASDPARLKLALEKRACKIVNIKIQRVGGLARAIEMYDLCASRGVPVWMGTMPELGIASLHALYMSMLSNCTYPTDVEASRRWYVEDIIDPPIEVIDGLIGLPAKHRERPNVDMGIVERYIVRSEKLYF